MNVLVIYDDQDILAWLVGESVESAGDHIANGYPHILEGFLAGIVRAVNIEAEPDDLYNSGAFGVMDGEIRKISWLVEVVG